MTARSVVNAHPSVVPALDAWRLARAKRDRVLLDGRYSDATRRRAVAEADADAAGEAYDRAAAAAVEVSACAPAWISAVHRTADDLIERANKIRAAAATIARIVDAPNRSESRDGAAWDAAMAVLETHGITNLPHSANLAWED